MIKSPLREKMKNSPYPLLLSPIKIGSHQLKNRVIMGSMHTGLEEEWDGFDKLIAFYKQRAQGGVAMIITGGVSPNCRGRLAPFSAQLSYWWQLGKYKRLTAAIQAYDCKVCLQILHAGRYAHHPFSAAPSAIQAPISRFKPSEMSVKQIDATIQDYRHTAKLAKKAGFDGVEIMGSEGYLINQFLSFRTNQRSDEWGGSLANRARFVLCIIDKVRQQCGPDFIIVYRISLADLVEDGMPWHEVVELAHLLAAKGVDLFNSGIGWHESRVPTIASSVPSGAFTFTADKLKQHTSIPVVATNRINMPDIAEQILQDGHADMICMARPFLADPEWLNKASIDASDTINTCIACNQACLDHVFAGKRASCLVNPQACHETEYLLEPTERVKSIAVVGGGPAGMAFACFAAERGHKVCLFERAPQLGGLFNCAKKVPGKEDFAHTIRYFEQRLLVLGVVVKLGCGVTGKDIKDFDECVIATGVKPRLPQIEGIDHSSVLNYKMVFEQPQLIMGNVAIIGAGGIGIDLAHFLSAELTSGDLQNFLHRWKIDPNLTSAAGLYKSETSAVQGSTDPKEKIERNIYLLQRKAGKIGNNLGKTTGWIHRKNLNHANIQCKQDLDYLKIDDHGLHIMHAGKRQLLEVDHVIVCAGQESRRALYDELLSLNRPVHLIGGARRALSIDAKLAIEDALRLAIKI